MKNNYLLFIVLALLTLNVYSSHAKGWKAKHVIWIGLDRWGSFSVRNTEFPSRVVNEDGIFPTIFSLLKKNQAESEIGCIAKWDNIFNLFDTLTLDYDIYTCYTTVDKASEYIKNPQANFASNLFWQI